MSLALSLLLGAPVASACGGFFCDSGPTGMPVPIDQNKERIVFAVDADKGTVDVQVQIFFEGDARRFAWVVPVPGVPDVGLGSTMLFDALVNATQPFYQLNRRTDGRCNVQDGTNGGNSGGFGFPGASDTFSADAGDSGSAPPPVVVLKSGQSGPFDYQVVQATSEEALRDWLADPDGDPQTDDKYFVPPGVGAALGPYVADGSAFVAFKLASGAKVGDIAPIRLTYPGTEASIPLVLTAIAAVPDMRLEVYVLGAHRAVPSNYLHVVVNEAAIDWLGFGQNHDDVITRAANEAGGQAFGTDYAGPVPVTTLLGVRSFFDTWGGGGTTTVDPDDVWPPDDPSTPGAVVEAIAQLGIPADAVFEAVMSRQLPLPPGAVPQGQSLLGWYACGTCVDQSVTDLSLPWDGAAAVAELDERLVQPARDAEALLQGNAVLTRLTSSMSPAEMTLDPRFVLNADLAVDVPVVRTATLVTDCGDGGDPFTSPRWIELADGRWIPLPTSQGQSEGLPTYLDIDGLPAAVRIERTAAGGQPELITDQAPATTALLEQLWLDYQQSGEPVPRQVPGFTTPEPFPSAPDADDEALRACGCQSGSGGGAVGGLLLLLPLLGLRRRR